MEISIIQSLELPKVEAIENFESANSIKIPAELKNFLLTYNPVYIEESTFEYNKTLYYIDRFYPFNNSYGLSLQSVFINFKDYFGKEFLAFANDPGDWQYVISLSKKDIGSIYCCRMDDVIPGSLTKIANSFDNFINNLKKPS